MLDALAPALRLAVALLLTVLLLLCEALRVALGVPVEALEALDSVGLGLGVLLTDPVTLLEPVGGPVGEGGPVGVCV